MEGDDNMRSPSSSNAEEPMVECGICGFTGAESVSMAHADAEHAMRPVYECGLCGFVFWKELDLSLHLQGVHSTPRGKPARECMFCALLFDTPVALNSHLREVHATSQPIMCRFCGVLCHGGEMVARHIRETHARTEFLYCNAAKSFDASESSDDDSGRCTAYFMSSAALAEHMTQGHSVPHRNSHEPTESGDASSGGLLMKSSGDGLSAPDGSHDARRQRADVIAPSSTDALPMNSPLNIPIAVPVGGSDNGTVPLAKNEDNLSRFPPSPEINFACVVCGLRISRVKDLNDHMSLLHRTCEAVPVDITRESLEAAVSELLPSPDGSKRSKPCKAPRWTSELDEMFLREIRQKGFSNDTLAAFQVLHTSDRSMASLRARGYQKGFKMVRSAPK